MLCDALLSCSTIIKIRQEKCEYLYRAILYEFVKYLFIGYNMNTQ